MTNVEKYSSTLCLDLTLSRELCYTTLEMVNWSYMCEEEIFKHSGLWCLVFPQFLPSGLFVDKEENCVERRTILNLVEMYVIASDLHSIENIVKCALNFDQI